MKCKMMRCKTLNISIYANMGKLYNPEVTLLTVRGTHGTPYSTARPQE